MNLKHLLILAVLCTGIIFNAKAQRFRVVGYLRNQPNLADAVKHLELDKITHLNIAFINPDEKGKLIVPEGLKDAAKLAHQKGVKILLSIGGGSPPKYLPEFLAGDKQTFLINSLTQVATDNDIDGIDVDLEAAMIDKNYESFIVNLASALKGRHKLITAAVATVYAESYSDKALAQFDFINVMSYDKTGPWNPGRPGQHAPYDMAISDLNYWCGNRKIPKERISLGVPFYGYGFGPGAPESISFKDLVTGYPGSENSDEVMVPGGGTIYYNGIPTIKSKVQLALQKAGGIMIWQLMQDASGAKSLLNRITTELNKPKTEGQQ